MFRAIGRWFKAVLYLITGQIDQARRALDTNPHVVRAKYEEIVRSKAARIQEYKQAVAKLIAQQENKMAKLRQITEEIKKLEKLIAGAQGKAKKRVSQLKTEGKSPEEIKADADYQTCLRAYQDFSSTLPEKRERAQQLEEDITEYDEKIKMHKVQLQSLTRELEKIKQESAEAVADIVSAQQEKEIADVISGISEDGSAAELEELRKLRNEVKAEARVSRELAGTDSKQLEEEFLEYANQSNVADEFDALVGLAEEKETGSDNAQETDAKDATLPE